MIANKCPSARKKKTIFKIFFSSQEKIYLRENDFLSSYIKNWVKIESFLLIFCLLSSIWIFIDGMFANDVREIDAKFNPGQSENWFFTRKKFVCVPKSELAGRNGALRIISDVISTPTPTLESFYEKFPGAWKLIYFIVFVFSCVLFCTHQNRKKFSAYFSVHSEMNVKGRITFTNRLVLLSFDEMADDVSQQKREKKICFWF